MWRRLKAISPRWAWALAAAVQLAITLPFWLYSSPAPYYEVYGDVYRGWPLIYGLDQGDVGGDEWGPFTAYFYLSRFLLDSVAALACGIPAVGLIVLIGRRMRRPV
jgi:hypothetical protein